MQHRALREERVCKHEEDFRFHARCHHNDGRGLQHHAHTPSTREQAGTEEERRQQCGTSTDTGQRTEAALPACLPHRAHAPDKGEWMAVSVWLLWEGGRERAAGLLTAHTQLFQSSVA